MSRRKLFGLLFDKLPTGEQPFFTQGYSHRMCQLRCFCLFSSPTTNQTNKQRDQRKSWWEAKWNQQRIIDFTRKTHTHTVDCLTQDGRAFGLFLIPHVAILAFWKERVPRWSMLCFGSDAFEGEDYMIHSVFNTKLWHYLIPLMPSEPTRPLFFHHTWV